MALAPGTRLGRYEIRSPLGAGGMGEVYLARDTSLQRDVAIKVLPPEFAADPSRLRRFQQEALATAAFNHPHIVGIFDVGTHDGIAYVVTELLDGRTLRDTLAAGALTVRKAVQYASQIAAGLAEAHDKGIVHRDLKPENVFVSSDDRIKILDFGIARVLAESPLANGETNTMATATVPGSVIGTVGYMAPEQVRGERVDHRADIFAFGALLYEMLTRRRAFKRDTVPQTLSAILSDDLPAWSGDSSPLFNRAMRIAQRCVEKSPGARFQSARDLSLVLADESTDASSAQIAGSPRGLGGRSPALAAWAAVAIGLGAFGYWLGTRSGAPATGPTSSGAPLTTFPLTLPQGATASSKALAVSSDGRFIATVFRKDGINQLFVLDLQSGVWSPLRETAGASQPFFSPDGSQIAFQQDLSLMRVALDGGPPNQICSKLEIRGGAWIDRATLLVGTKGDGLKRISVDDCATEAITTPGKDTDHRFPVLVPNTSIALFTIQLPDGGTDVGGARLGTLNPKVLIRDARSPQFANGHVIFTSSRGDVFAAPLDTSTMTVGAKVPLPQRPSGGENTGVASIKVAADGTLVYLPRHDPANHLAIVERSGTTRTLGAPPNGYGSIRFDPVHQRLVMMIANDFGDYDLAVCGLDCNSLTAITANQDSRFASWTPEGNSVVFSLREGGGEWLRILDIDGAARPVGRERSLDPPVEALPISFVGNRLLMLVAAGKKNATEIWSMTLDKPGERKKEYGRDRTEYGARVSSDGKAAWVSVENGVNHVAFARFPILDIPNLIGPGSGVVWSAKGDELFFQRGDQIWSQRFANGARVGEPAPTLIRGTKEGITLGPGVPSYDVLPDGRFIVILAPPDGDTPRLPIVVRNWVSSFDKSK
jgi:serine/threonine protein kinase